MKQEIIKNESLVIEIKAIGCPKLIIPVENFDQASKATSEYISKFYLGASKFRSAIIFHPTKGAFAHVSYNGRVWQGTEIFMSGKPEIKNLNTNNY